MSIKQNKKRILIVDDSEMNRDILKDILENDFEILEAENGAIGIELLKKYNIDISLVLLDIVMPEMDGFEVLEIMNEYSWIEDIPVVMISAEGSSSYIRKAYELGVTDFISRPFDDAIVYRRVNNTIMLYSKQRKLVDMVADQIYENERRSQLMIAILSHIVEFRNGESGLHVIHVQTITELLLKHLIKKTKQYGITSTDISVISIASALHDIGKIAIDEHILNKPGKLTDEEFQIMKTHASIGYDMLEELPFYQDEKLVNIAKEICRWHHERYDGRGYPDGLQGDEIPISAQVVSIADVYDALTSERVYKQAFSHEKAISMIINGECGAFNPMLLDCLKELGIQLTTQLKKNSVNYHVEHGIQNVASAIHEHSELSASEKTVKLLEYERNKYAFFSNYSHEIWFEYTSKPAMLKLSVWSAKQLHMDEIILDPLENEQIINVIGEDGIKKFKNELRKTTINHTDIEFDCEVILNHKKQLSHFMIRTIWEEDYIYKYVKFFGKMVKRNDC